MAFPLSSLFGGRSRLKAATRRMEDAATRLETATRLLTRIQRDVDQLKLFAGTVMGPDRAIALLATGQRILTDPRDRGCGVNLMTEGRYEETEIAVLRRYLRPGGVFLDIGANYGYYSLVVAPYLRPGGRVIAFEPNPHIHALLSETIYINGLSATVAAERLGVFDRNGDLRFEIDDTGPGGARIIGDHDAIGDGNRAITVPVVRLDDALPGDLIVDVVKIDVEGREAQVLRGMRDIIRRSPDIVILMEICHHFFADDAAFVRFIGEITGDLGLTISRVEQGGRLVAAGVDDLRHRMSSVFLSKGPPVDLPALTLAGAAFNVLPGTTRHGEAIVWSRTAAEPERVTPITHGGYVFLPGGSYRLVLEGAFTGMFQCRVHENNGDPVAQIPFGSGERHALTVHLPLDMPLFELSFWAPGTDPASFRLDRVELWPHD